MVDWTRQFLANTAVKFHTSAVSAFKSGDLPGLTKAAGAFTELLHDMERVLATDERFLLGPWIEGAKAVGMSDAESALYEYNARNQVNHPTKKLF